MEHTDVLPNSSCDFVEFIFPVYQYNQSRIGPFLIPTSALINPAVSNVKLEVALRRTFTNLLLLVGIRSL